MNTPLSFRIAFLVYEALWILATPFLRLSKRLKPGFKQRTLQDNTLPQATVWMQAASAGEAYLVWEILKKINHGPQHILITTNTKQGFEILHDAKNDLKDKTSLHINIRYCPFDRPSLMNKAVLLIKPKILVLLETEIWPGLLKACRNSNVAILIINGRLTPKSLQGYSRWKNFWQHLRPDMILAVSDNDARRFQSMFSNTPIKTMPNIKFDRMQQTIERQNQKINPLRHFIPTENKFVILGSIRKEEEPIVIQAIQDLQNKHPDIIVGIFPRHLHRINNWKKMLTAAHLHWTLRSQLKTMAMPGTLLLWDTFGELNAAYDLAQTAFVGGSLVPLGGHNVLEPLTCGVIPISGPDWSDFNWLGQNIVETSLLKIVQSWQELSETLSQQLAAPYNRENIKKMAYQYIRTNLGGSDIAAKTIKQMLDG